MTLSPTLVTIIATAAVAAVTAIVAYVEEKRKRDEEARRERQRIEMRDYNNRKYLRGLVEDEIIIDEYGNIVRPVIENRRYVRADQLRPIEYSDSRMVPVPVYQQEYYPTQQYETPLPDFRNDPRYIESNWDRPRYREPYYEHGRDSRRYDTGYYDPYYEHGRDSRRYDTGYYDNYNDNYYDPYSRRNDTSGYIQYPYYDQQRHEYVGGGYGYSRSRRYDRGGYGYNDYNDNYYDPYYDDDEGELLPEEMPYPWGEKRVPLVL
jgi:hypothetical protein